MSNTPSKFSVFTPNSDLKSNLYNIFLHYTYKTCCENSNTIFDNALYLISVLIK